MPFKLNAITGNLDLVSSPTGTVTNPTNPLYITPTTYFYYDPSTGILTLYVTGNPAQTWFTITPPTTGILLESGNGFIELETGDLLLQES